MLAGISTTSMWSESRGFKAVHIQTYDGKEDQPVDKVGDDTGQPKSKGQEDAQHSGPTTVSLGPDYGCCLASRYKAHPGSSAETPSCPIYIKTARTHSPKSRRFWKELGA